MRSITPLQASSKLGNVLFQIKSLDLERIQNNIVQDFINREVLPSPIIIDILRIMPEKIRGIILTQISFDYHNNDWYFFENNGSTIAQCVVNHYEDFNCNILLQLYEMLVKHEFLPGHSCGYLTLTVRTACVIAISKIAGLVSDVHNQIVDLQNTIIAEIQNNIIKLCN